jgi:hypothetical protein
MVTAITPDEEERVFGIGLILCGFALQSSRYRLAVLDVKVT